MNSARDFKIRSPDHPSILAKCSPRKCQHMSSRLHLHVVGNGGDEGSLACPGGAVQEQAQLVRPPRAPVEVCIPLELVQPVHHLRRAEQGFSV